MIRTFHMHLLLVLVLPFAKGGTAFGGPTYGFSVLADFNQSGLKPNAGMTLDAQGNLIEVTGAGGANGVGEINKISTTTPGMISTLASLPGSSGAGSPTTGLSQDPSTGIDYLGTPGVLSAFNPANPGAGVTTVANLGAGVIPLGGMSISGGIIGLATTNGGVGGSGSIDLYSTSGTLLTVLSLPGYTPSGGLVTDGFGNYWLNASGGPKGDGAILEVNASLTAFTARYSFTGGSYDGYDPTGKLTFTSQGTLLGETYGGDGSLFSFNPNNSFFGPLVNFNGSNGANPLGGLALNQYGDVAGVTLNGGTNGLGTAFVYNASTGQLQTVYNFTSSDGSPAGRPTVGPDGTFYGVTGNEVFALTPAGVVPEPATMIMTSLGLAGAALAYRFRRGRSHA